MGSINGTARIFRPLPHKADRCRWFKADITRGKVDQLLYARTGVVEYAEQNRVSAAHARMQIRLCEDLREVLLGEISNGRARVASQWNGQDLLALQQTVRHF